MRPPALARGGSPIGRGAHQRVGEGYAGAQRQHASHAGQVLHIGADAQRLGRRLYPVRVPELLRRRNQQQRLGLTRQRLDPLGIEPVETLARPAGVPRVARGALCPRPGPCPARQAPRGSQQLPPGLDERAARSPRPQPNLSNSRAASSGRGPTSNCGKPSSTSPPPSPVRSPNSTPTRSASSRRETKARTCNETRSSHWASSTTQSTGWASAASASNVRVASPTKNRPAPPPRHAKDGLQSGTLRRRQRRQPRQERNKKLVQPGEIKVQLRLDTCDRRDGHALLRRPVSRFPEDRRLADPRLAPHHHDPA